MYTKQDWVTGEVITENKLDHMEQGIEELVTVAEELADRGAAGSRRNRAANNDVGDAQLGRGEGALQSRNGAGIDGEHRGRAGAVGNLLDARLEGIIHELVLCAERIARTRAEQGDVAVNRGIELLFEIGGEALVIGARKLLRKIDRLGDGEFLRKRRQRKQCHAQHEQQGERLFPD